MEMIPACQYAICKDMQKSFEVHMDQIPVKIRHRYIQFAGENGINQKDLTAYLKWLRFYLDFCHKYAHPRADRNSMPLFKEKLKQKKQSEGQITQASEAISLFYDLIESLRKTHARSSLSPEGRSGSQKHSTENSADISSGQSWENEFKKLSNSKISPGLKRPDTFPLCCFEKRSMIS